VSILEYITRSFITKPYDLHLYIFWRLVCRFIKDWCVNLCTCNETMLLL